MKAATAYELEQVPQVTQKQYLVLAIPLVISGISTPILGAVDTAVVGRIPDPALIGGVAIGAVIFNTMYWLLGFLRVSTSGFTAQAQGAGNQQEMILSFIRPMIIAVIFGLLFVLIQKPVLELALFLIGSSEAVSSFASTYFFIRIWGAPFILLSYVLIGWLVGMGHVKLSLALQIFMNLLNIILSIILVLHMGMGIEGVAFATLISEVTAVLFGACIVFRLKGYNLFRIDFKSIMNTKSLLKMLKVNRDLFLRTVCLLTMTGIFTAKGASMGEVTLAANAILLQIQYLVAYLFGGFANASGILVGRAIGGRNYSVYKRSFSLSAEWGFFTAIMLSICILLFGDFIIALFTTIVDVQEVTKEYLLWMVLFPFVGFWGLQLEGIFSGATEAKSIRDSIILALLVFLIALWIMLPSYNNHGLWFAFIVFSLSRSLFLSMFIPKLTKANFP
ncbi:MATE family efflux transporter [Halalkalibacter akibai]|uniref:Putative multidrug extrusion protein n=1 Tax=Halalkalibacter akibai (strain ATCC 43226 / DSM 21942 / CIP 109018 / JCM 9157 / 1139) TaxID=1236973 RepID=W4QX71_HALA3|nr:MATE family efflux transporter [Halalkalibacter akibai]GAE36487.1 putative multidrug extrusion protein [Halalkalibacter akibai JCM 9157]